MPNSCRQKTVTTVIVRTDEDAVEFPRSELIAVAASAERERFSGSRLFWRPLIVQYYRDPFQHVIKRVVAQSPQPLAESFDA